MSEPKPSNPAGWLASLFVTSRMTSLVILACGLLGTFAILNTPREENPQIVVPAANVYLSMPGASAVEMERLLVQPLEGVVKQITSVDHVHAVIVNSAALVSVQFKVGADKGDSLVALYDVLAGHRDRLPDGARDPVVRSMDVDNVPVVTITLTSDRYDEFALKQLGDRMIDHLRGIGGVSNAYVQGGLDRAVRIELDPAKLAAYHLTWDQLRDVLRTTNLSAGLGNWVDDEREYTVLLSGSFALATELEGLVVGTWSQRPIYLNDVATIQDGPSTERSKLSRFAFGPGDPRFNQQQSQEMPAVTLALAKKRGVNAVVMADKVLQRVEEMKATFIPAGVDMVVTRNDGKKADDAVNHLLKSLAEAILVVFLITVVSLGWREAAIVGLAVPLILALTLGADLLVGPTINRVTLFGLILALGLLVDDAIVVIENVHRHYQNLGGRDPRQATIDAVSEIGNATTLATFSIMTAFLAQLVLKGVIGQYFYPVAFNVPVAIFFSLLIAYTVTPWAAHRWLKPAQAGDSHKSHANGLLARFYVRLLDPVLDNRGLQVLTFGVLVGAILLACLQPAWQFLRPAGVSGPQSLLGVEIAMLPKDNKNTFNITIDLPEGSPIEQTDQVAREVGDLLRTQAEIANYQIWLGQGGVIDFNGMLRGAVDKVGPHVAEIRVNLTDKSQRDLSSILLVRDLRPAVLAIQERYPGSRVNLIEDPPGPPVRATVLAEIYGENLDTLEALGEQVASEFRQTPDVVEVHTSTPRVLPAKVIEVDRDKAALAGVSTAQVAQLMGRALSGEEVGRVHVAGERQAVPIVLAVPRAKTIDLDTLSHLNLRNPQGQDIPLSAVARVTDTQGDRTIFRKDYERVVYVAAEMGQSAALYAVLDINRRLHELQSPDGLPVVTEAFEFKRGEPNTVSGYHILWDGEMRLTLDAYGDMLYSFGLAVLFIYLLLVAHYQSFAIPLIAMSAIPLGLIGVFPGHWLVGQSFTATSMIGFIALAGVVVRNSLLIIDFVL
ncbi:MAG: efflux RND transporter permease subunit, partial [Porticoccaceae bacterium]